ncbi:hypothetical protein HMPREF9123_1586 [Neisseria bacilliformis ATCC BAA-1200]|uniref:Uncharacterized protein n=1 Tax=Neisseria bacilliformis ATCC BAA-1200 TaxID=888742 RepID=F2BCV6_9NEIS|nr:hypothetical protein HMPREF9123_1586 [Neisseria bacilliformis ATCC BAA-1200]
MAAVFGGSGSGGRLKNRNGFSDGLSVCCRSDARIRRFLQGKTCFQAACVCCSANACRIRVSDLRAMLLKGRLKIQIADFQAGGLGCKPDIGGADVGSRPNLPCFEAV